MKQLTWMAGVVLTALLTLMAGGAQARENHVTILYDGFGRHTELKKDWGFAALVEYRGKRILFDTGNDPNLFAHNVERLGVDLLRLDAVVISHRHGDHAAGLEYLLKVNPTVPIYVPADEYFGGITPPHFFQHGDPTLPPELRYFDGHVPEVVPHGTPWRAANFVWVTGPVQLAEGFWLVTTTSEKRGTLELPELSLVVETPQGHVLVAGCSHPGIERILEVAARSLGSTRFHMVLGGLHLVTASDAEVESTVAEVLERWKVKAVAAGHCSGERTFALLQQRLGRDFIYAGVGSVIPL